MSLKSRAVGWLALSCIAAIVVLNGNPQFTNASQPARGIGSPVIALEVARNVDEVDDVLGEAPSPDREAMRIKQYIDFFFIASYSGLYIALAWMLRTRLAAFAMICGLAAAVFDVIENFAILRLLKVPLAYTTQAMVDAIRYPSLAKWALAFAASALFGASFWRRQRSSLRTIAAFNFAAAAIGLYGIFDNAALLWAGIPLFAGLVTMVAVFWRFR